MIKKILLVLGGIMLIFAGWQLYHYQSKPLMDITSVNTGKLISMVSATVYVRSEAPVIISSRVSGIISTVNSNAGDEVKKGNLMAALDRRDILLELDRTKQNLAVLKAEESRLKAGARKQEVRQADINLAQAQEDYKQAQKNHKRTEKLYAEGAIALEALEKAQLQLTSTENQLRIAGEQLDLLRAGPAIQDLRAIASKIKQAEISLKSAENQLNDTIIKSPLDGTVLNRQVEGGTYVQPGTPLFQVVDIKNLKVEAEVDEKDIWDVQVGQKAIISGKTLAGRQFEGTITKIAPVPKDITGIGEVKYLATVKIKPDMRLRNGMTVDVEIITQEKENVLTVPYSSLIEKKKKYYVFVYSQGLANLREVQIGAKNEKAAEVVTGIRPGENVLVNPPRTFLDKTKIRAKRI